jgi:predicted 2-oxoglutarate/Fe(II)-dependent dioxygenase YbiX
MAFQAIEAHRTLFDDVRACFFGISIDPADEGRRRLRDKMPGVRFIWDFDLSVSRQFGAVNRGNPDHGRKGARMRRFWMLLDPALRVVCVVPFAPDGSESDALFDRLRQLPEPGRFAGGGQVPVPILCLPSVFEPELCRALIDVYERQGGVESGFMRDVDGKTKVIHDHQHKRRRDCEVTDRLLMKAIQHRVHRRISPEILKVHHFDATHLERYIVACYSAEDAGHFRAHRDNTTIGTAHRRFAVSINLNEDFDGGAISFPEFGSQGFRPPVGGAVVFSCSLLHAVSPVTRGRRLAFLPFLYDAVAAKVRESNRHALNLG